MFFLLVFSEHHVIYGAEINSMGRSGREQSPPHPCTLSRLRNREERKRKLVEGCLHVLLHLLAAGEDVYFALSANYHRRPVPPCPAPPPSTH